MDTGILERKRLLLGPLATAQVQLKVPAGKRRFFPTRILAELMRELIFKVQRLILMTTQITICTDQALRLSRSWMVRHKRQTPHSRSYPHFNGWRANRP